MIVNFIRLPRNSVYSQPYCQLPYKTARRQGEDLAAEKLQKMLKRATLVGETTAGANHAANLHAIGDNFYVATVEVRAINPYSKHNWNDT